MGILSNTVSICHFRVTGDLPSGDLYAWVSERLAAHRFQSIEQSNAEESVGWVHLDDHRQNSFDTPAAFWRDHYIVFTLRRDRRKLPAALVKAYQKVAEQEYLSAHPGLSRVPKQKREEMKESVKAKLLAKTLPVPSTWDAVWDTRSGLVTFTSISQQAADLLDHYFKKTFEGLRLVAVHPYSRAEEISSTNILPLLRQANKATTDAILDLMKSNQWLGWEFMLWLLYRTRNENSEYRVCQPGPGLEGEGFVAYLNDRIVLQVMGEQGAQKVTVAGPQDNFREAHTALANGKRIIEATLHMEKEEHLWKLTLKGEQFHFASCKAPKVTLERDNTVDEGSEKEAVFYERMYVLEQCFQLFDSLYADFLRRRLGEGWGDEARRIEDWLSTQE